MRICVVSDILAQENNGTTIAAMNLIRSLKKKGHEVRVICPTTLEHMGEENFFFVPVMKLPKPLQSIVDKNNVCLGKADNAVFKKAMAGCDVVHIMFPLFVGPKAAAYAKNVMHLPVTCGFHAQAENVSSHFFGLMNSEYFNKLIYKHYYKTIYKYADAIHYPTQFIEDVFDGVVGKTNGYVISNGVQKEFKRKDVSKPESLKDKKVILFTGRLSKEKSHSVLIKAVSKSLYENDIQLIFAGQGPEEKKLKALSKKLLTNQPIFGFYSHDELIDIINYADLYCHPAEIEIEAISCLEAISCGLVPVIANSPKCATKAFALDDRSLFEVNNPDSLASKIDYWLSHDEERLAMKDKYEASATQFDFEECMNKMEKMLIDVVGKKNEK